MLITSIIYSLFRLTDSHSVVVVRELGEAELKVIYLFGMFSRFCVFELAC